MKVFFIGIFDKREPNTAFRDALRSISSNYQEISHTEVRDWNLLQRQIKEIAKTQLPNLIFMQLQGANILSEDTLNFIKRTGAFIVQWTGDARQPTPNHYLDIGSKINLSLFGNTEDIEALTAKGINADFLQISADHTIYKPSRKHEIVFMGNNYPNKFPLSKFRQDMCEFLKKNYGDRFGVYGLSWGGELCAENLMYNQVKEAEVYQNCKIAINCSHYDLRRYTSDRFFRILLSGAFCLSKEFPNMDEYLPDVNFATFKDLSTLKSKIDYYLENDAERINIAKNGHKMAISKWTWKHRANELLKLVEKWKQS